MRYPGAFSVEVEEILPAIPDIHCNAWRKHLKGEEMMDPKDVVVDDEEEEGDDLLIQVRDVMFNETTAMHVIVDKFNVKQTTIHRQLYGKKYPGGGQTLEQMKARTDKTEKHMTTQPVDQSKTRVETKDTEEEDEAKMSKGKGKGKKSQVRREQQKKFKKKVHQRGKNKRPRNEKLRRQR